MSRLKQFLFDVHLWLGLGSGIIVSILCFTGAYLAFQPVVEDWLNRDLYRRATEQPPLPIEELLKTASDNSGEDFTALEIPTDPTHPWSLRVGRSSTLLEPGTAEFLAEPRPFLEGSYRFCFRLHRWLLLEQSAGRAITGAATVIFVVILLTGVILWVQKTAKKRKRGLLLRWNVGWKRFNYDSHLVLGLYSAIPLTIMAISGLFWSYRDPFVATVYRVLDGSAPPVRERKAEKGEDSPTNFNLPYQAVREYFDSRYPEPGVLRISFPKEGEATFSVVKQRQAGFGVLPIRDEVQFRVADGTVAREELFQDKSRAEKVLSLIKAIHTGEVYGAFSISLYILCSLIGAILPISGTIMWWNRTKGRFFPSKEPRK